MFPRLGKLVIAAVLCTSLGLHWALLQSVAWVGMVVSYAQSEPLPEALRRTFDGQHPCKVCTLVAEGKKSEDPKTLKPPLKKLEFPPVVSAPLLDPPPIPSSRGVLPERPDWPLESPPTPPPRAA